MIDTILAEECAEERSEEVLWILDVDLSRTSLAELPKLQNNYQFCTKLNLSGNNLKGSVTWLLNLKRLQWIDLSHNDLTELSDVCASISNLLHLNVSHNNLSQLPEWIWFLEKIVELNLSYNPISRASQFHYKVAKWKKIQVCNLENTNLVLVPESLKSAPELRELYVGNGLSTSSFDHTFNNLWIFPEPLPPGLCSLDVSNVCLPNMETNWKSLHQLRQFRASTNNISWFPYDLLSLDKLEECDLSSNQLLVLPTDFGMMHNLRYINFSYNRLVVIPKSFERLTNLRHLDLYSNLIESFQCDIGNLSSLEKCDLWMNVLDPQLVLTNHTKLCDHLQETLSIQERKARQKKRLPLPSVSSDEDNTIESDEDRFHLQSDRDYKFRTDDLKESSSEDISDAVPVESRNQTCAEETWDDDDIYMKQFDLPAPVVNSQCTVSNVKNEHYFLPSDLHSTSCIRTPHFIDCVEGQFEDAD